VSGLAEAPAATVSGRWLLAGRAADVPLLEGRTASLAGRRVAVFRLPGRWVALDADCPHAAGPLADGIVADACVTCPLHGRRFDLMSGQALNGPETVAVHEVREIDGELWIRLA